MEITNAVALNVKAVREEKKLTLEAAAELTGVSRSMLAQIERGDANPTISILWKIANGYKVSFSSLIESRLDCVQVVANRTLSPIEEDSRYRIYPIFTFDERKSFEIYRVEIDTEGSLSAQAHLKGAEEYITVFSGSVEITVDGTAYRLESGDSIRFCADVPHAYKNLGKIRAEMNMLIYYNG